MLHQIIGSYTEKISNIKTLWLNTSDSSSASFAFSGNAMEITVDAVDNLGGNDFLTIMSPLNAQNTGVASPFNLEVKSDASGSTCVIGYGTALSFTMITASEFSVATGIYSLNGYELSGVQLPITSRDNYILKFDNVSIGDVITVNYIDTQYSLDLLPETWVTNDSLTNITYASGILKIDSVQLLYSMLTDMSLLSGQTYEVKQLLSEYRENSTSNVWYTDESNPPTPSYTHIRSLPDNEGATWATDLIDATSVGSIGSRWFFDALQGVFSVSTDVEFRQLKFIVKYD